MKYFAVFYQCVPGQEHRVMEEAGGHIRWVQGQIHQKRFLLAGPFINEEGQFDDGLCIMKAESKDELKEELDQDPFVRDGVRTYQIRQWDYHVDETGYRIEFPPELKQKWGIA